MPTDLVRLIGKNEKLGEALNVIKDQMLMLTSSYGVRGSFTLNFKNVGGESLLISNKDGVTSVREFPPK